MKDHITFVKSLRLEGENFDASPWQLHLVQNHKFAIADRVSGGFSSMKYFPLFSLV